MKFGHVMFHLSKDTEREMIYKNANEYLSFHSKPFKSPTFEISSQSDYLNFISNYPDFNLDPSGYNLDNIQGWRYGEVGILASNWMAWNLFFDSDLDYLILMEDDLIIHEGFFEALNSYMQELPSDWDIFHMYHPGNELHKFGFHLMVSEHICKAFQDWSSACYVINKRGAKKLIEDASNGISLPLDWLMFRQQDKFNVYTRSPYANAYCELKEIESTFQTKQGRQIL